MKAKVFIIFAICKALIEVKRKIAILIIHEINLDLTLLTVYNGIRFSMHPLAQI